MPVIAINDAADAVPLAQALIDGGLPCAEVTFRTTAAADAIKNMTEAFPDMVVGAGTVLTCEQVDRAVAAGAKFIVSWSEPDHRQALPGDRHPGLPRHGEPERYRGRAFSGSEDREVLPG